MAPVKGFAQAPSTENNTPTNGAWTQTPQPSEASLKRPRWRRAQQIQQIERPYSHGAMASSPAQRERPAGWCQMRGEAQDQHPELRPRSLFSRADLERVAQAQACG